VKKKSEHMDRELGFISARPYHDVGNDLNVGLTVGAGLGSIRRPGTPSIEDACCKRRLLAKRLSQGRPNQVE
jgi:hypothetical protein